MSELSEKLRDYVFDCIQIDGVAVPLVYDAEVLMEKAAYELEAQSKLIEELREALQWMVDNDETNEGDEPLREHGGRSWNEMNAYWIDGINKARTALSKANPHSEKVE